MPVSSFLLFAVAAISIWLMMGQQSISDTEPVSGPTSSSSHLIYSTVTGFFMQDDLATDPDTFDLTKTNFGLINQKYDTDTSFNLPSVTAEVSELPASSSSSSTKSTQWQRFAHKLATMNAEAPAETTYKLFFLSRHGQGYHNVAESFYGTKAWDCYYSTLDGNSTTTWFDAHLTPLGIAQANATSSFLASQLENQRLPPPTIFFSSPMTRALHTANLIFAPLFPSSTFQSNVLESLRECIGIHTCDRRSTRSAIALAFPQDLIEQSLTEEDELWLPDLRESADAQTARLRGALDQIFEDFLYLPSTAPTTSSSSNIDSVSNPNSPTHSPSSHPTNDHTYISITSHSGTIAAILRAVGHRPFSVQTGGIVPVLLRVQRVPGHRREEKLSPWTGKPDCDDDDDHLEVPG